MTNEEAIIRAHKSGMLMGAGMVICLWACQHIWLIAIAGPLFLFSNRLLEDASSVLKENQNGD